MKKLLIFLSPTIYMGIIVLTGIVVLIWDIEMGYLQLPLCLGGYILTCCFIAMIYVSKVLNIWLVPLSIGLTILPVWINDTLFSKASFFGGQYATTVMTLYLYILPMAGIASAISIIVTIDNMIKRKKQESKIQQE